VSTDQTSISPSTFTAAGETVAATLERAAIPGRAPLPTPGTSPADTAAAALAAQMGTRITAASAEMAPRGPTMRTASQAAAAEIQAQDLANSQKIKGVSTSQSAIDQLMGNMSAGPGTAEGGPPMTSFAAAAGEGKDPWWTMSKTDWATTGAGYASDYWYRNVESQTRNMIEAGAEKGYAAPNKVTNYKFSEGQTPGFPLKGLTKFSGVPQWMMAAPNVLVNHFEEDNTWAKSITREVGGLGTGTLVGVGAGALANALAFAAVGSAVPGVGTVVGFVVGGLAATYGSKATGALWDALGFTW
jgi:hypothetical protein